MGSDVKALAIQDLKRDEGFRDREYLDTEGQPTIGYGTLLPLTEEEGALLLEYRFEQRFRELSNATNIYMNMPEPVRRALCNMAYNLGVPKLQGFKRMWAELEARNFFAAAWEAWDSKWRRQVGRGRASRIVTLLMQGDGADAALLAPERIQDWIDNERDAAKKDQAG